MLQPRTAELSRFCPVQSWHNSLIRVKPQGKMSPWTLRVRGCETINRRARRTDRGRTLGNRHSGKIGQQGMRSGVSTMDTVRDAHAVISIAGEFQSWIRCEQRFDVGHMVQMSDVILRHRLQVACDAHSEGFASETKQLPQVIGDGPLDVRLGVCKLLLL